MAIYTFFGHHDCPSSIKAKLRDTASEVSKSSAVGAIIEDGETVLKSLIRR